MRCAEDRGSRSGGRVREREKARIADRGLEKLGLRMSCLMVPHPIECAPRRAAEFCEGPGVSGSCTPPPGL